MSPRRLNFVPWSGSPGLVQTVSLSDLLAPVLQSASIPANGLTLTLTYGEALDPASTPSAGAFALAGTSRTVSSVLISGAAVVLTLSGAVLSSEVPTVSYTPGGAPIQDLAGNDAAALVARAIVNGSTVTASVISIDEVSAAQVMARAFLPIEVLEASNVVIAAQAGSSGLVTPQLRVQVAKAVITLGTLMRAAGTSPPTVNLAAGTGSLTYTNGVGLGCPGLKVRISSVAGGTARGQALFDLSYDSGQTWAVTGVATAASYAIPGGAAAGNTLAFGTGTYDTTQTWEGTVNVIRSTEGNSYTFTQATFNSQPVFKKAGSVTSPVTITQDCLSGTGVHGMHSTDSALVTMLTNDPALTVASRVCYNVADLASYWFAAGDSAAAVTGARRFGQSSAGTNGLLRQICDVTGPATITITSTPDPSYSLTVHNECWTCAGGGGSVALRVDDANVALSLSTLTLTGTLLPSRVSIMIEGDSAPSSGLNGYFVDLIAFSAALSGPQYTAWDAALAAGT